MKKIILSLCIAMVAFLSATYVNAAKPLSSFFYGRTFNDNYIKIYGYYDGDNCISYDENMGICGYYVLPNHYIGILPNSLNEYEVQYWVQQGYLIPFISGSGVYLTD